MCLELSKKINKFARGKGSLHFRIISIIISMCICARVYVHIYASVHTYTYMCLHTCTHTHTFLPLRSLVSIKWGHMDALWLRFQGYIFISLKTAIHLKLKYLAFQKQAENQLLSIWEQTFLSALDSKTEEHFNHTSKTPDYLIHEESEDIHQI